MRAKQYHQKAKRDKVLKDKIQAAVKDVKDGTVPSAAAPAWKHGLESQYTTIWRHVNYKTTLRCKAHLRQQLLKMVLKKRFSWIGSNF